MRYLQEMPMRGRLERWLWACGAALALGAVACVAWRIVLSPAGVVLPRTADAPWIAAPVRVTAQVHQWRQKSVPVTRFVASFPGGDPAQETPSPRYQLDVRALGDFSLFINGRPVLAETRQRPGPLRDWKSFKSVDVTQFVERGANSIRVNVRNPHGPGLLSLRLAAEPQGSEAFLLRSGPSFRVALEQGDGAPNELARAVLATDVAPHVTAFRGESPLASLAQHGPVMALCFALGAGGFLVWQRRARASGASDDPWTPRLPWLAALLVAFGWLQLLAGKFSGLDIGIGFDAASHLAYADWLREKGSLPRASDGWSMYHPPLFYLVSVATAWLAELFGASRELAQKLLPWLSGLALVALGRALVRRLLPGDAPAQAAAILFAGWLPMNLYLAAYYTNEGFHAALAGLALVAGIGLLVSQHLTLQRLAFFSFAIGLALLTKFTALVVAGVLGAAVAIRIAVVRASGAGGGRVLALRSLWLVAPALVTAGWFYLRNIALFGDPLVGNWTSQEPGKIWWSEPGFHTVDYYLRFGESFSRPFLASFTSFWDAIYSTAWGDGMLAGQGGIGARHSAWNYNWMAAGYLLAVPATLLLLQGFGLACWRAWGDPQPRLRAAFASLVAVTCAMGLATFWVTLALPYFGQAKAFYSLALVPVASLFFAMACRRADAWLGRRFGVTARAVLFGWLGMWFGAVYLSFAG